MLPKKYKADYGIHLLIFASVIMPFPKKSIALNSFFEALKNLSYLAVSIYWNATTTDCFYDCYYGLVFS